MFNKPIFAPSIVAVAVSAALCAAPADAQSVEAKSGGRCKGAVYVATDVNEPRPSESSARRLVKQKWSARVTELNGRRYRHVWAAQDAKLDCRQRKNGYICELRAKPCRTLF